MNPARRNKERDLAASEGETFRVRLQWARARANSQAYFRVHIPSAVAQYLNLDLGKVVDITVTGPDSLSLKVAEGYDEG